MTAVKTLIISSIVLLFACDASQETPTEPIATLSDQIEGTWSANLTQTFSATQSMDIKFNLTFNQGDLLTESIDTLNGYLTVEDHYVVSGDTIKRFQLDINQNKIWSREFLLVEQMQDTAMVLLVVVGAKQNRLRLVKQ